VSTPDDVLLEPMPVSPPQMRVIGEYSDEQISMALYGRANVPIRYVSADSVEVLYGTLLPKWKPAFREAASAWEKKAADETVEHTGPDDGTRIWKDGRDWTPLEDPQRGGMVVGYVHHASGVTEVLNTAGETVFMDEIGVESVHIPLVDDVGDVLRQGGYVLVGLADAWLGDNLRALGLRPRRSLAEALGIPRDAMAYRIGRGGGHLVAGLQAVAEIVGGAALLVGSKGAQVVGLAGGGGVVAMPVAVVSVAGTAVVIHGGALGQAVLMSALGGEKGGGGAGGSKPRGTWEVTAEGTEESRVSRRFGRFWKSKSDGLWWSRDQAGHGGSKWKVYQERSDGLHWIADADEFGDFIEDKHKGPIGLFIDWSELIPVP
jgi:hypothetical protein